MPGGSLVSVFKTASFRIFEPTNHKRAMLRYALRAYHENFARILTACLNDPEFRQRCARVKVAKGKETAVYSSLRIAKEVRQIAGLRNWACAPLREYLISDAAATLGSYFAPRKNAALVTNAPSVPSLEPVTEEEMSASLDEFLSAFDSGEFELSPEGRERVAKLREQGMPRHAARLERMLLNREAVRQAGRILRTTEPPPFRPIEFRHFDQTRGVLLLHRDGRFYAGLHLFGETSRYFRHVPLEGFINWKTRQPCSGKSPIVVLPLEMSREFHEREFLERGSPQSAKLIRRLDDGGAERFFLNITFRIDSPPVETRTCLGIDRGMAKIAACTLIGRDRAVIRSGLDFEGEAFFAEQRRYEREIAAAQRKGKVSRRQFRLRGRAGANALGEFANRLVAFAAEHQAQIVLERLNAAAMRAFLRRSQIARLKQLLDYKTQALGLPKPIEVPAAYSSQTCLECGCRDPANRPRRDPSGRPIQHLFRCVRCGYEANADQNASRFIALRGLHRLESKKSGSKDLSFESFLEWLAKK